MSTDKRVVKTKANIRKAFMELSIEKDANKISVSDISAKALVNRSTFYLHYRSIGAVAEEIERTCADTISQCISNFDLSDLYGSAFTMFNRLTDALCNDEPLKRYITCSTNSIYITERLKEIFIEKALMSIEETSPDFDRNRFIYPITFTVAGAIDCYSKWTKGGGEIPLDQVIAQLSEITKLIIDNIK